MHTSGESTRSDTEEALVQIHDFHRRQVGGIPALSFLIATRIAPYMPIDVREEDASIILLRVLDHADLPTPRRRCASASITPSGSAAKWTRRWDHRDVMDPTTHHLLSYAGVRCRVLGTFYISEPR